MTSVLGSSDDLEGAVVFSLFMHLWLLLGIIWVNITLVFKRNMTNLLTTTAEAQVMRMLLV